MLRPVPRPIDTVGVEEYPLPVVVNATEFGLIEVPERPIVAVALLKPGALIVTVGGFA